MNLLYRGLSVNMHLRNNGDLIPKGITFEKFISYGTSIAKYGSGITYGFSPNNAIIGHQTDSNKYPTSGVSTTPHFERAKYYATKGGKRKGIVYKINRDILAAHGVKEWVVKEFATLPTKPEDDEVILVHKDNAKLPKEIIIDIIEIHI